MQYGKKASWRGQCDALGKAFLETLTPVIQEDITLTCTTYLNIAADQIRPLMEQYSLMAETSFSTTGLAKQQSIWGVDLAS